MPEILLGEGILNWQGCERRSDRYGYVHLYPHNIDLMDWDAPAPAYVALAKHEGHGQLLARILVTRQSQHIGDLARGIFPSTPTIGDTLILGEGMLDYEGSCVGLIPDDGRETDWLDPEMLYRCHQQTVALVFVPTQEGNTP